MTNADQAEWLHHSIDSLGVSLLAPIGYLVDPVGDEAFVVWDGVDADQRSERDVAIELRRTGMAEGAAMAATVSGFGRLGSWTGGIDVELDGMIVVAKLFVSDGLGGPMRGLAVFVDGPFPLVIRAEWADSDDRFEEIVAILATVRMTSTLDPVMLPCGRRSSVTSPALLLSVALPTDAEVIEHLTRLVLRGDGWLWVAARVEQDLECSGARSAGGIAATIDISGQHLAAAVAAGGSRYRVVAEGMDSELFCRLVDSLRYHQFLAV